MWHGITSVSSGYSPIISESPCLLKATVFNAGPATVRLKGWSNLPSNRDTVPDISMEIRPGSTRVIASCLIRLEIIDSHFEKFASIGWRIANIGRLEIVNNQTN